MEASIDFDLYLRTPICLIIAGPTKCGKTELTKQLILRKDEIMFPPPKHVVYYYGSDQPLFDFLKAHVPGITFHKGLPERFEDDLVPNSLTILDDLLEEGSHHMNVSVIFISQLLYHAKLRPLTLNASYACIFKNPRDTYSVSVLGRQMNCNRKNKYMEQSFDACIRKPHGYIFVDLNQQTDDSMRLRDSIFPDQGATVFVNEKKVI